MPHNCQGVGGGGRFEGMLCHGLPPSPLPPAVGVPRPLSPEGSGTGAQTSPAPTPQIPPPRPVAGAVLRLPCEQNVLVAGAAPHHHSPGVVEREGILAGGGGLRGSRKGP